MKVKVKVKVQLRMIKMTSMTNMRNTKNRIKNKCQNRYYIYINTTNAKMNMNTPGALRSPSHMDK